MRGWGGAGADAALEVTGITADSRAVIHAAPWR